MNCARFFVTAVCFLITLPACHSFRVAPPAVRPEVTEGNAKIRQALALEQEFTDKYHITVEDLKDPSGRVVKVKALSEDYNWRNLPKADRDAIKEKLSLYLALINEVLELDARKGIYVTEKERVIKKRDGAYGFQKSLEQFEKRFGENFEPKPGAPSQPVYLKSVDV